MLTAATPRSDDKGEAVKRLIIIGAGGFGRETLAWALDANARERQWEIAGFLDANPRALDGFPCDLPILGDPATFTFLPEDAVVCAIGDPAVRLKLCRLLKERGASFTNVIHPTAVVGPGNRLGEGLIFCPGGVVTTNVTMADHVILNVGACVGHDAVVGAGCTLNPHCDLGGFSRLGEGVFLGGHADILPYAIVGDFARVGAGSVVLKKVDPYMTVVGVPSRVVMSSKPQEASSSQQEGSEGHR